jgi:hypothetical protein
MNGPSRPVPTWVYALATLGLAVAVLAFATGLGAEPAATWRALYINLLFWISLACGAVTWSAVFRVARATWTAPINQMGHALTRFLPVLLIVFAALFPGRHYVFPWIGTDLGDRAWWLNAPFLFLRDGLGLVLFTGLSLAFVRAYEREDPDANRQLTVIGVALLFTHVWVFTLLGFDLVMSLMPVWHSALFGGYFALGGLYLGMAVLVVMSVVLRRWLGVEHRVGTSQFRDLGNLLMAFAMVMTYFFYSQAMPIWYENLPPEVVFAIPRIRLQPWLACSWILLFTAYLGVFALLVVREMKERPATLFAVALFALLGMHLERYLLVTPSLAPEYTVFPVRYVLIDLGFLGALVLTAGPFLARMPAVSELDLALKAEQGQWQ